MGKTYRRFSSEFKLQLVEAYLAGKGSIREFPDATRVRVEVVPEE